MLCSVWTGRQVKSTSARPIWKGSAGTRPSGTRRASSGYGRHTNAWSHPTPRASALAEVPEPPPAHGLTVETELRPNGQPGGRKPALAGIPLAFLLSLDPFSDLIPSDFSEETDDA